jgi:Putative beta-barrel porin-2, OmpL-like. bbp2/Carboxypeptidase regulatory-like domain
MKSVLRRAAVVILPTLSLALPIACSAQDLAHRTAMPVSLVPAYNQPMTGGELRGMTQNSKGLPLSGVQVVIHSVDDNSDRTFVSGRSGTFVAEDLKPGQYKVTAVKIGFARSQPALIDVAAQQSLRVNLTLSENPSAQPVPPTVSQATDVQTGRLIASNTTPAPAAAATLAANSTETEVPAAIAKQLADMEARIEELEAALKARDAEAATAAQPAPAAVIAATPAAAAPSATLAAQAPSESSTSATPAPKTFEPQTQTKADPFSYADYTWLNGTSRNKDTPLATKYFTPEVRFDTNYIEDYNQPRDHTMGGSTESFRSDEVQLEQMSFGGDIHVDNVRGRVLTMFGLFSTTTPRNDGSAGVGQWNLDDAYKYFSEAWGGYHFNVNHGLNIDAGIFVSYIGLFSYYNFDNWTYQPSFVSSNTPWFFNGVRIQWFPTEKLKIEPWFINGWQSYAKYNGHPGLGGQILWRPTPYLSFVFNNYGMGTDTLGVPGRSRIHTDDSAEVRYYNHPDSYGLDKMAFSVTGDLGCEYGGGVSCHNDSNGHPKQMFAGWMLYNRFWFHKDLFAATIGGGVLDNPGRYLTLLQPIDGATAVSGSPYFPAYPGSIYKAWDSTVTFDYMPSEFITFRFETGYRYANVPYWTGRGGITPPGGNVAPVANNGSVGTGASYICTNGSTSTVAPLPLADYSGQGLGVDNATGAVTAACASLDTSPTLGPSGPWTLWQPDLRRNQWENTIAIMVKW